MARKDSIEGRLPEHIDKGRDEQNGFDYAMWDRLMRLPGRPLSWEALKTIFNRNAKTVRKWYAEWHRAEQQKRDTMKP